MKRQLLAGLAAGLLGVSGLVAQQQPASNGQQQQQMQQSGAWYGQAWQQYPGQTWQDRLCGTCAKFTIAGEYFYRDVKVKQPYSLTSVNLFYTPFGKITPVAEGSCPNPDACSTIPVPVYAPELLVQSVLDPYSVKGRGNFGTVFTAYQYRCVGEPYFALRARWASGEVERRHHNDTAAPVFNDNLLYFEEVTSLGTQCFAGTTNTCDGTFITSVNSGNSQFFPVPFTWSEHAHEWNVEARLGYTFGLGACNQFGFTPYLGVGYEAGRMNLVGRVMYSWMYIPVGFVASYQFTPGFSMALDADFGMMAGAKFIAYDEPAINNIHRHFDNKYRWELELPLTYQFNCWGNGNFSLGLVPFWHGWRTLEKLTGEVDVAHTEYGLGWDATNQFHDVFNPTFLPTELAYAIALRDARHERNDVVYQDQPVATPRMLNNSWGGRLELAWAF
jgi:hypothetical protein